MRRPTLEDVYLVAHRRDDERVRLFFHQLRAEQLVFWRSREAAFFIFLFPLLLFVLLGSVYSGHDLRRAGAAGAARRAHRLRLREHGVRGPRDPARAAARARRSSSGSARRRCRPRPTSRRCSSRRCRLRAPDDRAVRCSVALLYGTPFPRAVGSLVARARPRRRRVRRARRRDRVAASARPRARPRSSTSSSCRWRSSRARSGRRATIPAFLRAIGDVLPLKYFVKLVNAIYLHGHGSGRSRGASAFWPPGASADWSWRCSSSGGSRARVRFRSPGRTGMEHSWIPQSHSASAARRARRSRCG